MNSLVHSKLFGEQQFRILRQGHKLWSTFVSAVHNLLQQLTPTKIARVAHIYLFRTCLRLRD